MVDSQTGVLGHLGVALAPGLAVMVMIAAVGHVSGAHFNPAVTLAFAVTRHFAWRELPGYWLAQFAGAISAAGLLLGWLGPVAALGANRPSVGPLPAFGVEVVLTAVVMFVIISVATDTRAVGQMAALAIGATVGLNSLWAGPLSGASMNPARSFDPALLAGAWDSHWIFWLGPFLGAVIGAALYQALRAPTNSGAQLSAQAHGVPVKDDVATARWDGVMAE
jgi:MIP family channel proteins